MFCWKVNFHHRFKSVASSNRLSSVIELKLAPFFVTSPLTRFPVPAQQKATPQHDSATTMFLSGESVFRLVCTGSFQPQPLACRPKVQFLVSSDQSTVVHMFVVAPYTACSRLKTPKALFLAMAFIFLRFNKGQICGVHN
ncbi:hypothetical protein ATANTOWER_026860 [Ataeniobius toweri]|uniref:Uncharacterized protein n=1 Tax=Ataeniobius toweri TaxID=208326 RepID=A0ABU7C4B5_9TELE|nr:hypothetical protein [Ataeniobius toweri]